MRTNAIVRIVLYSIAILVLTGILLVGVFGSLFSVEFSIGNKYEHEVLAGVSFDADRISKIEMDWAAGSVYLVAGEPRGAEGDITLFPSKTDKDRQITYEFDEDTLKISYTNASVGIQTESIPPKDMTIYVPEDWFCEELEIDGAALKINIDHVTIGTLDINAAACEIRLNGAVNVVDCDGADCKILLDCKNEPTAIDLDGAACELNLLLPENCGFMVDIDGLSSTFHSTLPYTENNGKYTYGNQQCKITADGISCKINVNVAE